MGRKVFWHLRPSLFAPVPPEVSTGCSLSEPRSPPMAPWGLLSGPLLSPKRPVLLGRPSPLLWHGPLPGVVGLCEPGYLLAVARLHGRIREGGRAPLDDGTHGWSHSPGGGARWPKRPPAPAPGGEPVPCVLCVTPHRVPAGGGRGRLDGRAVSYDRYGSAAAHVRCPFFF